MNSSSPCKDSTSYVFFIPQDFTGKLAALIPSLRLNLTRFLGVFALKIKVRIAITASQRVKNSPRLEEHLKESDKHYHARKG
jgi:hypothetical protein|tara:strand:+ start:1462 stop:1707 length:246 start_codon:yes stop_codon:yes gene_type:complete